MSLRLLVVEDDAASREFIRAALAGGATVDTARTLAEAGAQCAEHDYHLLLLDVALPDGEGDAWLARQRAIGNRAPAIALTAELDHARRRRLLASGFVEALGKPISEQALREAVELRLAGGAPRPEQAALWDEAQGLSAVGGAAATLDRLRGLFLDELPRQRRAIVEALENGDTGALRAVLHQLLAGCGFVGAGTLAEAVQALQARPHPGPEASALLERIDRMLREAGR
ncbi:response regulator [Silanimonas lenta]|uniref:response regulator n=1 Tax=Silanimonas lenta TaxID=265429 RepID=UPI002FE1D71E